MNMKSNKDHNLKISIFFVWKESYKNQLTTNTDPSGKKASLASVEKNEITGSQAHLLWKRIYPNIAKEKLWAESTRPTK